MRRPSYRHAVEVAASIHGEDFEGGPDDDGLLCVALVSEIFDVPQSKVAGDCRKALKWLRE